MNGELALQLVKSGATGVLGLCFIMAMRYAFLVYMEKQKQQPVVSNGSSGQRSVEFWRETFRDMLREALRPIVDELKEQSANLERMHDELRKGQTEMLKEINKLRYTGRVRGGKDDSP